MLARGPAAGNEGSVAKMLMERYRSASDKTIERFAADDDRCSGTSCIAARDAARLLEA